MSFEYKCCIINTNQVTSCLLVGNITTGIVLVTLLVTVKINSITIKNAIVIYNTIVFLNHTLVNCIILYSIYNTLLMIATAITIVN